MGDRLIHLHPGNEYMDNGIFSAIDASVNRALEGLRVCEDVARFCLRRSEMSGALKEIRHRISSAVRGFDRLLLLSSRDVDRDSQKFINLKDEMSRESLEDLFSANIHRAIEAVRSLEEFAKLVSTTHGPDIFQEMRFSLYQIEKEVISLLNRQVKRDRFNKILYAILDSGFIPHGKYSQVAKQLIAGGARAIQLRMKQEPAREILPVAEELAEICSRHDVLFIVNDYPHIAMIAEADGVHLGEDDLQIDQARRIIRDDMIIGISTHSYDQALEMSRLGPDYIAIGPIFNTATKGIGTQAGIGVDAIARISSEMDSPLVAIGGITAANAALAIVAGADALAVISVLYKDDKIENNCRELVEVLESTAT